MSARRCIDELLFYMPIVCRRGDDFTRGFAKSIMRQAKRAAWQPSAKQEALMRRLVNETFATDEPELFDDGD